MKLSEMNTDQLSDLYIEIAPAVENITSGEHWPEIAEAGGGGMSAKKMLAVILPMLLKYNRMDVFTIIGATSGTSAEEIAKQPFPKTLAMVRELLTMDFDMNDFLSPSVSGEPEG